MCFRNSVRPGEAPGERTGGRRCAKHGLQPGGRQDANERLDKLMADVANRSLENVPGKFYVDNQRIDCDRCRRRKKPDAGRRWRGARSKRSGTTAKAECDRARTMNCPAKPAEQMGESEALARASDPRRFRRLKWNELVWPGDFVADERLGLQPWEGPSGFRAGSFVRPIYRKEETERIRPTAIGKSKRNTKYR